MSRIPPLIADYAVCHGCSLCLLVCPVWKQKHDMFFTAKGRAKGLQQGSKCKDLSESILHCTLCSACEPVCPENLDVRRIILRLRRQLFIQQKENYAGIVKKVQRSFKTISDKAVYQFHHGHVLLANKYLHEQPEVLTKIKHLLGKKVEVASDDAWDIALAVEMGIDIPTQRLEQFLKPLRTAKQVIVTEGILYRSLCLWLPESIEIITLGQVLSQLSTVRKQLQPTDLYIIEERSYHSDYQRLVKYYDKLRQEKQCQFNLDLQRIAIPTTRNSAHHELGLDGIDYKKQVEWILAHRNVERVVVEHILDKQAFQSVTDLPVVHLAEVA